MSDFLKILLRKTSLRKHIQDISISDIEKVIVDLTRFLNDRRQEEAAKQAEVQAKQTAIEEIRKAIKNAGLDVSDLMSDAQPKVSLKKSSVKDKYQITDDAGQVHRWTGRGRTPNAFVVYMQAKGIGKDQLPRI
jgi:DNA-binding protein H-NS